MPEKLAINGGKPIRKTFLPYGKQWITDDDNEKVLEVLKSDYLTTGPFVQNFEHEFAQEYMVKLRDFLKSEQQARKVIYPPKEQWFNAFLTPSFDDIKMVIVGQDPYHGEGQAHGLSFSVPDGIKIPPSLRNIYKELNRDLVCRYLPLVIWKRGRSKGCCY